MESFVSRKFRIIASAIEIISESGIDALTTKTLAMKENMSESLLYKYFGGIDEVLVEIVDQFVQFDTNIRDTVMSKEISNVDKIKEYLETYATYYGNYPEITVLLLNYEALLHNYNVREKIAGSIKLKNETVEQLAAAAIEAGEITDLYEPRELNSFIWGGVMSVLLKRRVEYHEQGYREELMQMIDKLLTSLRLPEDCRLQEDSL